MPDFTIRGNPAAIRSRAANTHAKGRLFFETGAALAAISVEGWTGRAADHFREAHDLEPDRWTEAGNGFVRAGTALEVYASAVENAQRVAAWAEAEYARGEQVTRDARAAYDVDVAAARQRVANAASLGQVMTLTILPFDDPGAAVRANAVAELEAARSSLETAAQACADEVRRGCAAAPEEPNWLESGLRFVGGVLEGAGEALWDLATLTPFSAVNMVRDLSSLAAGDLTVEELQAKYRLSLETAQGMVQALRDDPVAFGKELGKGLLDWDTWADDPARAIGHLVPDAIAAAATAGAGTVATRGAGSIDDLADGLRAVDRVADAGDLRHLDDLDDLDGLDGTRRLDNLPDDLRELVNTPVDQLDPDQVARLVAARDAITVGPGTPMQRVITPAQVEDYLSGSSEDPWFRPNETFGFAARAEDVAHLRTPQELFDGLGLDYEGTPYRADGDLSGPNQGGTAVTDMHVLRYEATPGDEFIVPRHSSLGGDGSLDAPAVDPDNPFTGNGYTSGGIPEFRNDTPSRLVEGSQIWRIEASGRQQLVAVLKDNTWAAVP
ncbi:putative T7SS-secreted protein [Nocardioides sp. GCM10027113]|uniref:putative T7SS-secreted protein n=1 Tax=unclassified Nocardioides TaxID=2615069 RepID=UPI003619C384